jgi:hypothetical protein
MKIICKYKDAYDYLCFKYGQPDSFPFYDRRECFFLENSRLFDWLVYDLTNFYDQETHWANDIWNAGDPEFFGIEIGYTWYIIEASQIKRTKKIDYLDSITFIGRDWKEFYEYDGTLKILLVIDNVKHHFKAPFTIGHFGLDSGMPNKWRKVNWSSLKERDIKWKQRDTFEEGKCGFSNPIIKDTKLPGLIGIDTIYNKIDSYLSSLYNDKEQYSAGITDVEKAINHGFDKKESFRNIKK